MVFFLYIMIQFFKYFYLKGVLTEKKGREIEKSRDPEFAGSLHSGPKQLQLGFSEARSQEQLLGFPLHCMGPRTLAMFYCLSRCIVEWLALELATTWDAFTSGEGLT